MSKDKKIDFLKQISNGLDNIGADSNGNLEIEEILCSSTKLDFDVYINMVDNEKENCYLLCEYSLELKQNKNGKNMLFGKRNVFLEYRDKSWKSEQYFGDAIELGKNDEIVAFRLSSENLDNKFVDKVVNKVKSEIEKNGSMEKLFDSYDWNNLEWFKEDFKNDLKKVDAVEKVSKSRNR